MQNAGEEGGYVERGQNRGEGMDWKDFMFEELEGAIRGLKKGRASGIDELRGEIMGMLPESAKWKVLQEINKIWRRERPVPDSWRIGRVVPVHKGGDWDKTDSFRPITLMGAGYKVAMGMLAARLEEETWAKNIIPEVQGGFRKGRGAREQIVSLARMVECKLAKGEGMCAVFLDLQAAYDTVPRMKMIECMRRRA